MRLVLNVCVSPPCSIGPRRDTSVSNAPGQSSSALSVRPMRCSDKSGQMMSDLRAPCGPVVRDVVPPHVELVTDSFLGELAGETSGRLERAGRVLPCTLADDEHDADAPAQPVEMVPVKVRDVVGRVAEVH